MGAFPGMAGDDGRAQRAFPTIKAVDISNIYQN
jgi:hypothetical protein